MDIDPIVKPDVVADAWNPPFGRDSFDVVILDPPYDQINAQMKVALFRQAVWMARERVIWFHTQWSATYGGVCTERCWLVRIGDGCHVRCLQFFTPRYPKQPPYKYILRGPGIKYNRWHGGDQLGLSLALPQGQPRQPSK
jgi:hypothetical protein